MLNKISVFTCCIYLFLFSFIPAISIAPLQVLYNSEALPTTVSEFHAKAPQATANEGLAQGPYVAARAGFEPTTFQTKGVKSTTEPTCPAYMSL